VKTNQNDARAASVEEVLALVRESCRPLETERVPLGAALGRVLREPVCAPEDQPPFDRAAMDGYAIRLDDSGLQFRVVDEIHAGDWKPRRLQRGEAVLIATGGALPCDGMQVVMKENVRLDGATIRFVERGPARNIRFRGEDARRGHVLVKPGTVLQPGALALLASIGQAQLLVTRLPRVVHAVTGDELVPPEQTPQPGQIRDSNSTLVHAFLKQWSVEPEHRHVPDDESRAERVLASAFHTSHESLAPCSRRGNEAEGVSDQPIPPRNLGGYAACGTAGGAESGAATADLLLISGGASVGERDFTRRLLERFGYAIRISQTNTRPGKPLIVAQRGSAIAFGLPGNPLAHFVCLNLYVRAALDSFSGCRAESPFRQGQLATELEADGNARETFWPARQSNENGCAQLRPLAWTSSGDLTSLATANALIRVPAACRKLARDAAVEYVATRPFA